MRINEQVQVRLGHPKASVEFFPTSLHGFQNNANAKFVVTMLYGFADFTHGSPHNYVKYFQVLTCQEFHNYVKYFESLDVSRVDVSIDVSRAQGPYWTWVTKQSGQLN